MPSVFGHEAAGIVEKIGNNVTKVKPGDHVVLSWDHCRKCPAFNTGNYCCCENFLPDKKIFGTLEIKLSNNNYIVELALLLNEIE